MNLTERMHESLRNVRDFERRGFPLSWRSIHAGTLHALERRSLVRINATNTRLHTTKRGRDELARRAKKGT